MRGRTDHLLEIARQTGKLLLSYSVAAWLAYLGLGLAMSGILAAGSMLPLILALVVALPAPLLLSRRSSRRAPELEDERLPELDSASPARLLEVHQHLQHQTGMSAPLRARWEESLRSAWLNAGAPQDVAQALSLRDLLHASASFGPRELELLHRLGPLSLPPVDLLLLWQRVATTSLSLDHVLLGDVLHRLPVDKAPRALRKVRPLLFRLAREGQVEASSLLKGALSSRRLRLGQIPEDLRNRMGLLADAGARAAGRVARGAGDATRGMARRGNGLRVKPLHLAILGSVAVAVLLAMVWKRQPPPPPPTPPLLPMDFAPPGNVQAGFTLQIMSSRDSAATAAFVAELHADSIYAYTLPPRKNSTWYRVRLGWFAQRGEADSVAAELKEQRLIDEWYVANFDLTGRMHETLSVPVDSLSGTPGAAGSGTKSLEGKDATP